MLVEFSESCADGCEGLFDNFLSSSVFLVLGNPVKLGYLCGSPANICEKKQRGKE